MRWIFKYNEQAKKYLERLLKTKIAVEPQPWLHVAVKTMSNRNPWCGYAIYVWDTREIQKGGEYRSRTAKFTKDMFTIAKSGMSRALDNREPLKGGRKDANEFFEFGEFDASKSEVFDGKERVKETKLYKKYKAKAGNESYDIVDEFEAGLEAEKQSFDLSKSEQTKYVKYCSGLYIKETIEN